MRFSFRGKDIEISFWFFAVVAIFASVSKNILAVFFILPVLIHESGHLLALAACRVSIESIRFTAFGIDIKKKRQPGVSPVAELTIMLAGAAANLAAAAGAYFFGSSQVMLFVSVNIAVAVFNLLPIGNLDGGEIARLASGYWFTPRTAFILSRLFSFLALVPLFAAAIFLILTPHRNFTLLLICVYLLTDVVVNS